MAVSCVPLLPVWRDVERDVTCPLSLAVCSAGCCCCPAFEVSPTWRASSAAVTCKTPVSGTDRLLLLPKRHIKTRGGPPSCSSVSRPPSICLKQLLLLSPELGSTRCQILPLGLFFSLSLLNGFTEFRPRLSFIFLFIFFPFVYF